MSRDASITLDFGDGTYLFRLRYGELIQLQELCDAGPEWVLNRLYTASPDNRGWRMYDITQTIRLGLIGGGMEPLKALGLVRTYVEQRPPMESRLLAYAVLAAGLMGAPEDKIERKKKAQRTKSPSRSGGGDSRTPSGPAQP